jgi:UDP-N-acetylglucosamine acyltransferase
MSNISPKAIVEPGAKLSADVVVGPFSYIGPQVRIGPGCVIANNATVTGRTTLGEKTRVFPMAVIGTSPEGGEVAECVIGKANTIREQVTIYGGAKVPTRIGNDNLIMINCMVGQGASMGDHGIVVNGTMIGPEARVDDYIHTSAFVTIAPGVSVGAYTFIAGYADVDHDAPPYAIVMGSPFRVRGVNAEKLKRCGFGEDDIRALKEAFRDLFNGEGHAVDEEALARLAGHSTNPHVRRLVTAIQAGKSKRRRR